MKRIIFIAVCVLLGGVILINSVGCSVYDPYRHGKVVDANTKEPLEGVVVMGVWDIDIILWYLTMAPLEYYDAKETVTDEDGDFTLGLGPWFYPGFLQTPRIKVYKRGYKPLTLRSVERKNGRGYIYLRKPDVEESVGQVEPLSPFPFEIERSKIKRFLKEINYSDSQNMDKNSGKS